MLFNSQPFLLAFLPLTLGLYTAAARSRPLRQGVVILASLVFYGWWDVRFVPLLVGLTLANWLIVRRHATTGGRALPTLGIVLNLLVLGICKYTDFFAATAASLLGRTPPHWDIVLPLGISFFVFQKISYLVDLRRGERHHYGFLDFCMFVTFFPQLIAGPLVRHNEIIPQFAASPRRAEMWENIGRGALLLLVGLVKKAGIADTMALTCDPLFATAATGSLSLHDAWAAAGTYTLQIYFDFSGYSDMAIGLARMFGLTLPINFNAPYRATSIRDFWRRWHITLSRFLRDYLYIPLGGNRAGAPRQAVNVVLTMLLGGLWHGAGWSFVAWGGLHGAALAVNGFWTRRGWTVPAPLGWVLTLLFVIACWVLFRAADFPAAARLLAAMAGDTPTTGATKPHDAAIICIAVAAALLGPTSQDWVCSRAPPAPWLAGAAGLAAVLVLLLIGGRIPNAFIYFRF